MRKKLLTLIRVYEISAIQITLNPIFLIFFFFFFTAGYFHYLSRILLCLLIPVLSFLFCPPPSFLRFPIFNVFFLRKGFVPYRFSEIFKAIIVVCGSFPLVFKCHRQSVLQKLRDVVFLPFLPNISLFQKFHILVLLFP